MSVRRATAFLAVSGWAGIASSARAAVISQSSSAPTTNVLVSQLNFDPNYTSDNVKDGGRDFTDNSGPVGQTFTVASAAQLQAITVHGNADDGDLSPTQNFHIRIGSVNTTTRAITTLSEETAPENVVSDNDYLTFTLTSPVPLAAGTLYSFSIYSEVGWYGLAHSSSGDIYAGGGPFNSNTSTQNNGDNTNGLGKNGGFGSFAAVNPNNYDFVFSLQGSVPEPTSLAAAGIGGMMLLARRRRGR